VAEHLLVEALAWALARVSGVGAICLWWHTVYACAAVSQLIQLGAQTVSF
jgi:hypothetical protein